MALEFDLSIDTKLQPIEALSILSEGLNLEWTPEKNLRGPAAIVGAFYKRPLGKSVIAEEFGFQPTIDVWFRISPKEEYQTGKNTVLRATMELLGKVSGDAVLLFNGEELVLKKIGSQLLINKEWGVWHRESLAEISLPYAAVSLRSPHL